MCTTWHTNPIWWLLCCPHCPWCLTLNQCCNPLHSFFVHSLKEFPKFIKFVKTLKIKGVKLLRNVKTWWISMLSMLKCVMVDYKALIVKMHFES